ncbi:unnamed protein product [Cylicocyclus nassatus]|uniref:Uncharacterized protein n=1 Tax=Cylicocyclus nassatus TaxID=53992 RepID=A0AA36GNT1_CYLNA|nr:unnamed protein product [Cylicocyclus nassatus]
MNLLLFSLLLFSIVITNDALGGNITWLGRWNNCDKHECDRRCKSRGWLHGKCKFRVPQAYRECMCIGIQGHGF